MNLQTGKTIQKVVCGAAASEAGKNSGITPRTAGMNEVVAPAREQPTLGEEQVDLLLKQISLSPGRADLIAAIVPNAIPHDIVTNLISRRFPRVELVEVSPDWSSADPFDLAQVRTDNFTKDLDVICIVGLESVMFSTDPEIEPYKVALNSSRDRFKRSAKCPIVYVMTEGLAGKCNIFPDLWSRLAKRFLSECNNEDPK